MGGSHESFNKKNVREKKEKKRKEKEKRRLNKQESRNGNNLDDMIAYVDEFGNITSTPPDPSQKTVIKAEDIEVGIPKRKEAEPEDKIRTGIVTFFNESKGYGFIKDLVTQQSVFVHANGLTEPIKENNKVTYEVVSGPKGYSAVDVKLAK
jgi:cold shock CspA family protein